MDTQQGDRRQFLKASAAIAALGLAPRLLKADEMPIIKTIPKSGEALPVIGMGTSRTFDTHDDDEITGQLQQVIQSFFELGGGMIDSSPMYGAAQQVLGRILPPLGDDRYLFNRWRRRAGPGASIALT
jgi:hypothetical protein